MKEDLYRSQFRMPYELYEKLKASADQNHRSVNAELVAILSEALSSTEPTTDPEEQLYSVAEIKYFIEKATKDLIAETLAKKSKE